MSMIMQRRRTPSEIVGLSPMREFEDIYDRLGRLMNAAMGELTFQDGERIPWIPMADVSETEDAYLIEIDMPGVAKEHIDVQLSDRELIVSGEVKERERDRLHRRMRRTGRFEFRTMMPGEVNAERVSAQLADGVLTLTVPKAEVAKPRHIEVAT
jgi:Molecular chaperone (small heat shock protein)